MMTKPAKFKAQFPIIESRYDDFVATHVNITLSVQDSYTVKMLGMLNNEVEPGAKPKSGLPFGEAHSNNELLPWHRYYISLWEDALVNERDWHLGLPCELPKYAFIKFKTNSVDWNWYLDIPDGGGSFLKSPIWDPESGFGSK
jgi:hypothetical protein